MLTKRHNNLENSLSLNFNLLTRVCAELALVPGISYNRAYYVTYTARARNSNGVFLIYHHPIVVADARKNERIFCRAMFLVKY